MYRVLQAFRDLQDKSHFYKEGEIFPRHGKAVSLDRIEELKSGENLLGVPLIQEIKETTKLERKKQDE